MPLPLIGFVAAVTLETIGTVIAESVACTVAAKVASDVYDFVTQDDDDDD